MIVERYRQMTEELCSCPVQVVSFEESFRNPTSEDVERQQREVIPFTLYFFQQLYAVLSM